VCALDSVLVYNVVVQILDQSACVLLVRAVILAGCKAEKLFSDPADERGSRQQRCVGVAVAAAPGHCRGPADVQFPCPWVSEWGMKERMLSSTRCTSYPWSRTVVGHSARGLADRVPTGKACVGPPSHVVHLGRSRCEGRRRTP
jgi:hypothetical protein